MALFRHGLFSTSGKQSSIDELAEELEETNQEIIRLEGAVLYKGEIIG